jgi:metal-responsive CopG/Arc/MetJ family transcriptional regulator
MRKELIETIAWVIQWETWVRRSSMNHGITHSSTVKTAISINSELLEQADEAARRMGLSRSGLFSLAIGDFLERKRREHILFRLNEVYADGIDRAEKRLLKGIKAKVRRTVKEHW